MILASDRAKSITIGFLDPENPQNINFHRVFPKKKSAKFLVLAGFEPRPLYDYRRGAVVKRWDKHANASLFKKKNVAHGVFAGADYVHAISFSIGRSARSKNGSCREKCDFLVPLRFLAHLAGTSALRRLMRIG